MGLIDRLLGNTSAQQIKKIQPLVKKINALEDGIKKLSDAELRHKTVEFRERLAKGETLDQLLPEAFAVVREAAVRTIGQTAKLMKDVLVLLYPQLSESLRAVSGLFSDGSALWSLHGVICGKRYLPLLHRRSIIRWDLPVVSGP